MIQLLKINHFVEVFTVLPKSVQKGENLQFYRPTMLKYHTDSIGEIQI